MNSRLLPLLLAGTLAITSCAPNVTLKSWPQAGKRMRVAVLPFKDHPERPGSGNVAYEAFSTHILEVKDYDVVDRGALEQILKEQKMGLSGALDQSQAVEIGKLLGAEGVIVGAVTEYQQRRLLILPPAKVSMTARLVNTRTGLVEWSATHSVGGAKWIFAIYTWPILLFSPSADDQIQRAARAISRAVQNRSQTFTGS